MLDEEQMSPCWLLRCPEPGGSEAPLRLGACKQRWRGLGEPVPELYGSCLGRGQVCFSLFKPQLWFSASPAVLLLFTYVVLGLEPIGNAAGPCPRGFT